MRSPQKDDRPAVCLTYSSELPANLLVGGAGGTLRYAPMFLPDGFNQVGVSWFAKAAVVTSQRAVKTAVFHAQIVAQYGAAIVQVGALMKYIMLV